MQRAGAYLPAALFYDILLVFSIKTIMLKTRIILRTFSIPLLLCAMFFLSAKAALAQDNSIHTLKIKDVKELQEYFRYTGTDIPLISGHRGGAMKGFPENCIATFENTLRYTPATFEVDPRLTKDSVIVLMHDATLDRTTTGKGKVSDYTWEELKKLKLKDPEGNITQFRIPSLDEAIAWSRGKTVLILDKKDVPLAMTARIIKEFRAEAHVMVTVHNAEQAAFFYEGNNDIMFEAFVKTKEAMESYEKAGIPWKQIMAYTGPLNEPANKALYDALHQRGVMCMISTAPVYDKLTKWERERAYREIIEAGADIIEADLAVEVAEAIRSLNPDGSPKDKFFAKNRP